MSTDSSRLARGRARPGRTQRFLLRAFLIAFAGLVVVRAAMPVALRAYVLRVLRSVPDYRCHLGNIDLNLWRGAYEIEELLVCKAGMEEHPLFEARRIDLSVQWLGLLSGSLVGEATLHQPIVRMVLGSSPDSSQTGTERSWGERFSKLFPLHINRFVARDGELHFLSPVTEPPVDLYVRDFYLEVLNLTNIRETGGELMAQAEAAGRPFGTGELEASLRFDPLAELPRFELNASVRKIEVVELNDFLQAFGAVDAEGGTFEAYAEFAADGGVVEGYVKTLFEGLRLLSLDEIDDPGDALEALWEGLVAFASEVLENQPYGRLATRIPMRGTVGETRADLLALVANLLRNAFVAALRPAIDDSIELVDMEVVRGTSKTAPSASGTAVYGAR